MFVSVCVFCMRMCVCVPVRVYTRVLVFISISVYLRACVLVFVCALNCVCVYVGKYTLTYISTRVRASTSCSQLSLHVLTKKAPSTSPQSRPHTCTTTEAACFTHWTFLVEVRTKNILLVWIWQKVTPSTTKIGSTVLFVLFAWPWSWCLLTYSRKVSAVDRFTWHWAVQRNCDRWWCVSRTCAMSVRTQACVQIQRP